MRGLVLLLMATAFSVSVAAAESPANQWMHLENVIGSGSCAARLTGSEVDTMLVVNGSGQLILVAGRADWQGSGPEEAALRIDDFQIEHLQASAFNNLVLLEIGNEGILKRLQAAKDLYWTLPSGKYHAAVAGLGDALDWVRRCEHGKHPGAGG